MSVQASVAGGPDAAGRRVAAAVVAAPGTLPRLGQVAFPTRAPGSTLLRVVAAPLNPLDLLIASGNFHSARYETAYVPGSECVGIVQASDRFETGDVVYAECRASPATPGSLSTHVVVPDEAVLPVPDGVDPLLAAAVGNSGTAAFMPLIEIARLRVGETVLVLGATGVVGQLAVQIALRHGAGQVIGVGRDSAALDRLLELGADTVVQLRPSEPADALAGRLRAAADAVHVVLDGLYGQPLEAALGACSPRARVVNIGNLAGPVAHLPAGLLRGKQLSLVGFAGLHTPLSDKRAALTWLWEALARDDLQIDVLTYPLAELPAAWRAQAASPHAKCVVVPDRDLADLPSQEPEWSHRP